MSMTILRGHTAGEKYIWGTNLAFLLEESSIHCASFHTCSVGIWEEEIKRVLTDGVYLELVSATRLQNSYLILLRLINFSVAAKLNKKRIQF